MNTASMDSMGVDTSQQNSKQPKQRDPTQVQKGNEVARQEGEFLQLTAAAAQLMPTVIFNKGMQMGEISEKINGLREENKNLKEKLKLFKQNNAVMNQKIDDLQDKNQKQGKTIRELELSHEMLKKELKNVTDSKEQLRMEINQKTTKFSEENTILNEELKALKKEFEKVENENKELKNTLNELKDEIGKLKAENEKIEEKLDCKETRLALGQVAWMLEAEIWKAVLPDQSMGKINIFKCMLDWLKKNASSSDGAAAQKRWEELKVKLNWNDDDHKLALSLLKKIRISDAHPVNVDLQVARNEIKQGDHVANTHKKACEEIVDMLERVKILNTSN